MKKLLLFLFISVIIKANCQVIQKITGSTVDVTAQYIQFQKTNDSLKVVLTMAKVAIVKYKQDSASFKAWQGDKNAQVRLKMDSISNLKKVVKVKSDSILLLKTNLLNCSNQSKAVINVSCFVL